MKRPAWWAAAAAAAAFAAALAFLVRVPEGRRGVLEGRDGSTSLLLQPGLHLRRPILASLTLYPVDPVPLQAGIRVASREGAGVELDYSVRARLLDGGLERLHHARAGEELEPFLRRVIEEAMRAHAAALPLPRLLAPGSGRESRSALASALEPAGVWVETDAQLAWELPETPGAAQARAALRRQVQDTSLKVLLIGLDGADWELIDPLIERRRLPNLARLKREGAWGKMRSEQPMLSPLLWTTVATGRSPEQHGVMDFLMRDPDTARMVPISSTFRKVKALWNILSDFGVGSDFVAWWATWPAERVEGTLVSDRLSYSLFPFVEQDAVPAGTTYPAGYLSEIAPRLVRDRDIGYRDVRRFVDISEEEFRRLRARVEREPRTAYTDPVNHLTRILAATRNYHAIALDLLERGPRPLTAVYYQGIDEVNHRFAHFAPPRMDRIGEEEFRKYSAALERFYEYQDELIGELLERVDARTVVMVISDHGFANGAGRPRDFTPSIEGRPARWHTLFGIRILHGAVVKPGSLGEGRLLDVAPTVLRLLGVPLAADLEGKVWEEALAPEFLKSFPARSIDSYEKLGRPLVASAAPDTGTGGGTEFIEALRGLGYIGDAQAAEAAAGTQPHPADEAPEGATAAYHANLAVIRLRKGDLDGAEREFREALRKEPRFGPALGGLAEVAQRSGRNEEALGFVLKGIDQGPDPDDGMFAMAARLYLRLKREEEGVERFAAMVKRLPRRGAPRICHGILLLRLGRSEEAERVLREALEIDPAALPALQELFELYREQNRLPELERALTAALERHPRSAPLRNWLAWIREARGDAQGAERYFREALRDDPDHMETLVNLGSLLIDQDRSAEAALILERAVAGDAKYWQSRVNLIIALGREGRLQEARRAFEQAGEKERERPELLNALAYACYLNGEPEEARRTVRRSLTIDPEQPEARRLLETLEGG